MSRDITESERGINADELNDIVFDEYDLGDEFMEAVVIEDWKELHAIREAAEYLWLEERGVNYGPLPIDKRIAPLVARARENKKKWKEDFKKRRTAERVDYEMDESKTAYHLKISVYAYPAKPDRTSPTGADSVEFDQWMYFKDRAPAVRLEPIAREALNRARAELVQQAKGK